MYGLASRDRFPGSCSELDDQCPSWGGCRSHRERRRKKLRIGLEKVAGKRPLMCKTRSSHLSLRGSDQGSRGIGDNVWLSGGLDARGRSWRSGATLQHRPHGWPWNDVLSDKPARRTLNTAQTQSKAWKSTATGGQGEGQTASESWQLASFSA